MSIDSAYQSWVYLLALLFFVVVFLVTFGRGWYLDWKRKSDPYAMRAASSSQKWKWAAEIMFWYTLPLFVLGVVSLPLSSSSPDLWLNSSISKYLWPVFALICTGLWMAVFPLAVAYKRWDFWLTLRQDQRMRDLFQSLPQKPPVLSALGWMKGLLGKERWRFWEEGYPAGENARPSLFSVAIKLERDTGPAQRWFEQRYPDQQILYASAATVFEGRADNLLQRAFRQFFRLQGVLIVSEQWLVLKSQFLSWTTLMYPAAALGFFGLGSLYYWMGRSYLRAGDGFLVFLAFMILFMALMASILVFLLLWSIFQRRPYRQEIRRVDIQRIEVGRERSSFAGEYPVLTITVGDKTFKVAATQAPPEGLFG